MSKAAIATSNPLTFNVIGGVDESVQDTETDFSVSQVSGVFPFFTGTWQRLFGKKIIDVNREQSVMAIEQVFNGAGQFGYFVQTMEKLYYHLCETPADLFINYVFPVTLGVDGTNHTRNIFGQGQDAQLPQDTGISCLFEFPDKPAPPSTAYLFFIARNNWSYPGPYTRKGMVMYSITGASSPYTATEIARFTEGVDYPDPSTLSQIDTTDPASYLNVSELILAYSGAQRFSFLLWFQDIATGNNVYYVPLNQVVVFSGNVGMSNIGGKLANWPVDDVVLSGNQIFGVVAIADVANDQGKMSFVIST